MFELTTGADALGLQSVAQMPQLNRRHRGHGNVSVRKNVCLITLNGSLNGLGILKSNDLLIMSQLYYQENDCKNSGVWGDKAIAAFKKAASDLVAQRFLLPDDADSLVKTAESEGVRNAP